MSATFFSDLTRSQQLEKEFESLLQSIGCKTIPTRQFENYPWFDLMVTRPDTKTTTTFECKVDLQTAKTGNIAVELHKEVNGVKLNSGLSATEAEWYCYQLPPDTNYYLIKTIILNEMVSQGKHLRTVNGGDDGRYVLALFDKNVFVSNCSILPNTSTS
jgi:hypothetical protein